MNRQLSRTVKCCLFVILWVGAVVFGVQILISIKPQWKAIGAPAVDCQGRKDYSVMGWDVESLSSRELFEYFEWDNSTSCGLINFFGGAMTGEGTEVGTDGQKGVCLDNNVKPDPRGCLVYSFGISRDWSFDDTIATFGCQVFSFDPTIKETNHTRYRISGVDWDYTTYNYTIEFVEMGIDNRNYEGFLNKANVPMRTLKTIYDSLRSRHGDAIIDYLKIDIEHTEWRVLPEIIKSGMMDRVRQLGVEIHLKPTDTLKDLRWRASVLRSLEECGMIRFTSLYNQFSHVMFTELGKTFRGPAAFEIAYYNSNICDFPLIFN